MKLLRSLFTGEMGLASALVLIVIVANVGLNIWQRQTIVDLREWRTGVLEGISQAVDQRDTKGRLLPVRAKDATAHIARLGRFRSDAIATQAKARADDAAHVIKTERNDSAISRKAGDDFEARIAAARADADALRHRLAALSRSADGIAGMSADIAPTDGQGGRGHPIVPGLSTARSAPVEAPGADGLHQSTALSIDERQLATEQAIQLDELITSIEKFAEAPR